MVQALLDQDLAAKMGPPPPRLLDPTHPMYDSQLLSQQEGGPAKPRVGRPQVYSKLPAKQHAWYLEAEGENWASGNPLHKWTLPA